MMAQLFTQIVMPALFAIILVLDTIGENVISSHKWACLGQGIWPEFLSEFKDTKIINNTVVNSGCHGIFLHNNFDCEITGNVLFGNKDGFC